MKLPIASAGLLVISLAGCFTAPPLGSKDLPRSNVPKAAVSPRPPVVMADQVDESNAHAKARALEDELQFDLKQSEISTAKTPTP
jgi:hypothetical protein